MPITLEDQEELIYILLYSLGTVIGMGLLQELSGINIHSKVYLMIQMFQVVIQPSRIHIKVAIVALLPHPPAVLTPIKWPCMSIQTMVGNA